MARRHVMTAARKAALRKAQRISAIKRRGRSNKEVALYHISSPRIARKIVREQRFKTTIRIQGIKTTNPANRQGYVYFFKKKNTPTELRGFLRGYGKGQVMVKVPAKYIERDINDYIFGNPKSANPRAYMVNAQYLNGRPIKLIRGQKTRNIFGRKIHA